MKMKVVLSTLAAVTIASLGAGGTAVAAPTAGASTQIVGKVKLNGDGTATVKARYSCAVSADWSLWVSAKQTADGSQDPALLQEGSGFGRIAHAWLQSHPTAFSCDGAWHTQKFQIDTAEQGYGALISGYAYVQLCLVNPMSGVFVSDQAWTRVR